MSAEITTLDGGTLRVCCHRDRPGRVFIDHGEDYQAAAVAVPRVDFLAAVAKECDVIMIDRADLPEPNVIPDEAGGPRRYYKHRDGTDEWDGRGATSMREEAYRLLARAEYLDAHPPVSDLGTALVERAGMDREKAEHVARMLREDGWTK